MPFLPLAHEHLLSDEEVSFVELKGCCNHKDKEDTKVVSEDRPSTPTEDNDDEEPVFELISLLSSSYSIDEPPPKQCTPRVSFSTAVVVRPIPHSSTLSPSQRRKMFTTKAELRQNKIRNKKEYCYDRCDWRNATEEREMGVDMVTGESVHPAHCSIVW